MWWAWAGGLGWVETTPRGATSDAKDWHPHWVRDTAMVEVAQPFFSKKGRGLGGALGKRRRLGETKEVARAGLAGPRSRIPRHSSRPRADLVTTERGPPSVGAFDRPLPGQAHATVSRSQRSGPRWSWTALAVSAARLAPANLHTLAWRPHA